MPSMEFSQNYRHNLAVQLLSTSDRQQCRQILTEAQDTLGYKLAKGERDAFQQGVDFRSGMIDDQRQYQKELDVDDFLPHFMSNEGCLYKLFPAIKDKTGTIVAVGSDQGLDLFVNSQTQNVLMVDITKRTSLLTRTLLELGSVHKKIFGEYPTVEQYHNYFKKENVEHINRLLEDSLNGTFKELITGRYSPLSPDSVYYKYLKYKSTLCDDNGNTFSWNSSDENLRRVFEAYDEGRIFVLNRDLYTEETAEVISEIVNSQRSSLDVLYLSNSISYLHDRKERINPTLKVPLSSNSVILITNTSYSTDSITHKDEKTIDTQLSYVYSDWHYTAISYKEYKKRLARRVKRTFKFYSTFIDTIRKRATSRSPEKGATFIGIEYFK